MKICTFLKRKFGEMNIKLWKNEEKNHQNVEISRKKVGNPDGGTLMGYNSKWNKIMIKQLLDMSDNFFSAKVKHTSVKHTTLTLKS